LREVNLRFGSSSTPPRATALSSPLPTIRETAQVDRKSKRPKPWSMTLSCASRSTPGAFTLRGFPEVLAYLLSWRFSVSVLQEYCSVAPAFRKMRRPRLK
jgi:hypothetical protein